ncbi:type I toxin-antitoxin system SymE family toxin [Tahibacter soli]|uniref:Type I toxin-antitoxin system SymE family toxin n=1 Tax=Tahibacter soli TaxID=2983605 RepID=A0A9X3YRN8_9GAMM|nr:type I toxin-antitoxin system SymE family toxin [Tahibacter soli]MDC8015873.1 type I toxin-antitoxin system SymE family toxin [Tahibacter soli]
MAKRNPTSRNASTRQIRVGKICYAEGVNFAACDVPHIRLLGHWLADAGFMPDDEVTVRIRDGCLVLTRR